MARDTKKAIDRELQQRIDRLRSTVKQARAHIKGVPPTDQEEAVAALKELDKWLDEANNEETKHDCRVRLVLKTEAELCLYEPASLLSAEDIRLEDRLYRFPTESSRNAWKERLEKSSHNEQEHRQVLRHLTYELAEAAEIFDRLAEKRNQALRRIMSVALGIVVVLLVFFVVELLSTLNALPSGLDSEQAAFVRSLPTSLMLTVLVGGSLGAMINVVRSVLTEERMRLDYTSALLLNVGIRVAFGAIYAIVVVFALFSEILPVKPNDKGLLMFVVVAAVAAGWSDKLFGEVVSNVITGKQRTKATKTRGTKKGTE